MNSYLTLKQKQEKEFNSFPMQFAFSNKQFEEGMEKLGLKVTDIDKIYKMGDTGGFYSRSHAPRLIEMMNRHDKEMQDAINTNDQFIFEMFYYELGNHEYTYTGTVRDTLEALGLTLDEVNSNPRLKDALEKAKKAQWDSMRSEA